MLKIGATDAFERKYTQKFRNLAGTFGEFVMYERDRGARDIGLHLTRKLPSGGELLSRALCWFQLKGITETTMSAKEFGRTDPIKIPLKVRHLQYWYVQPMPTFLALFIESADKFLVLNLQKYVEEKWGRTIFELSQAEITIDVPTASHLDQNAFYQILVENDVREWALALGKDEGRMRLCRRDYDLIWHIGTARRRKVKHRLEIIDWQSKTRGEIHIQESQEEADDWRTLRDHWQYMLGAEDVEKMYPYLELYSLDGEDDSWDDDDDSWVPDLKLGNGDLIKGEDACGEYFVYITGVRLNPLGKSLLRSVRTLADIGLVEINEHLQECISIAPWERRSV
jgi:hypothetical protein